MSSTQKKNSDPPCRRWSLWGFLSLFGFKRNNISSPLRHTKQGVVEIDLPEVSPTPPTTPSSEEQPVGFSPGSFDPYADFHALLDMENVNYSVGNERGKFNMFRGYMNCFLPEAKTGEVGASGRAGVTSSQDVFTRAPSEGTARSGRGMFSLPKAEIF